MGSPAGKHRFLRLAVAFGVGLALAFAAWRFATDPVPRQQRALEEQVVATARQLLQSQVAPDAAALEIVDPLAPDRKVGKVYIYPTADGWQVSGHYRRDPDDSWHPWLMSLDADRRLQSLAVRDASPALAARAAADPRLSVRP